MVTTSIWSDSASDQKGFGSYFRVVKNNVCVRVEMLNNGGFLVSSPSEVGASWDWAVVLHVETYPTSSPEGCLVGWRFYSGSLVLGGRVGPWAGRVCKRHGVDLGERILGIVSPFVWSRWSVTGGYATGPTFFSNSFEGMWFWVWGLLTFVGAFSGDSKVNCGVRVCPVPVAHPGFHKEFLFW